jgi:hypothetical protein
MAKAIQKKVALEQLEQAEKEMTHLVARVQELRRQVKSASAPPARYRSVPGFQNDCVTPTSLRRH